MRISDYTALKLHSDPECLESMRIPRAYWRCSSARAPESCRDFLQRYLANIPKMLQRGWGLFLYGNRGVGKTAVATMLCRRSREYCSEILFISASDLRRALRERQEWDEDRLMADWIREVDVLVIDDLSPEDAADPLYGDAYFARLVAARRGTRAVTHLTTDIPFEEINVRFPRLVVESVESIPMLRCEGQDQRICANKRAMEEIFAKPEKASSEKVEPAKSGDGGAH